MAAASASAAEEDDAADLEIPNYNINNTSSSSSILPDLRFKLPRRTPPNPPPPSSSIFTPPQTLDLPPDIPRRPLITQPTPEPEPEPSPVVRYKECLKNHAAPMGSHVVDGCGEFMPSGDDGTPDSLRCAACDCHRSFHRKEVEGEYSSHHHHYAAAIQPNHSMLQQQVASQPNPSRHHHHRKQPPTTMFNFRSGGAGAESSSEDLNITASHSRKRFRTKFSQDQKDRMQEFASRIGWRIQKQDEEEVQHFCARTGIKRQVFKVWMHNNKQSAINRRSSHN